ncbi:unnamed protein product [Vitrella brassicaformis CCMP3155]|uniref:40S ribosomal protein S12 n=2 Tax=Vitrella brassicaformis TaxID=1169539 RepID=A0A0G4ER13_VITBC|nr:unnamed protein product [Vitrella brassicaformis CCMP3155]|mmetsp:Transcript_11/g.43  ORF Transcript_11/g.43 Transcript_11/m.43 type:complete len:144 (+) Transcript_11:102-533(+)|eukprot:CEL99891.1 unnamed protein product [Vitrella brassicaformis CCMP3155]
MSDHDEHEDVMEVEEAEEEITDLNVAIKKVIKNAMINDGLARGLNEVALAIEQKTAKVVFLAESVDEESVKKLVEALCSDKSVSLVKVEDSKQLGEWAGLCKIDKDGMPRKVVGASCVAVTDFGEESEALEYLNKHLKEAGNE